MSNIVVLGAGIGGISVAYGLKSELGKNHKITIINSVDYFQFVPSNVWVSLGWRNREAITVPLEKYLNKYGIEFIFSPAKEIRPQSNTVFCENETEVSYDYLIITTGPKLAFQEIQGMGPSEYTQSVCTVDHAEKTWEAYQEFLKDPGPIIIGVAPGASCFGPVYEFSFLLNKDLQNRKLRHKVPITLVTCEPYIGHLGLGGVSNSKEILESELSKNDIPWITNSKIIKINNNKMFISELDENGTMLKQHELPFNFSMVQPAFTGVDVVANVDGLCNSRGFVIIDEYQRSKKYINIFAAGVCVAISPPDITPIPIGVPKTGYMTETMVAAIINNISAEIQGKTPSAKPSLGAICLADMGNTGIAFVAVPEIRPRNINWAKKGKWVHLTKIAFEKYFLYKVKHGLSEPICEKYIFEMLGIKRLV